MKIIKVVASYIVLISVLPSCNRSKSNYFATVKICSDNIYVEIYHVGLLGGLNAQYLTDSINFKTYIGKYDDETEGFDYQCTGDSIVVKKIQKGIGNERKILEKRTFSLKTLKQQKKWD